MERRETKMEWQVIVALVLAVPIMLLPVAFVWYLTLGGMYAAAREARTQKTLARAEVRTAG